MMACPKKISRRRFVTGTAAATVLGWGRSDHVLGNGTSHRANRRRCGETKLIDVHVHLGQPWNERRALTAEVLLRWMDAHQIEAAWVLPLVSPEAWFYPISTDWVLQETRPFRDRLIPFCAIDPRTAVFGGRPTFSDLLRRYRDAGARGFGEHKWGGPIDDPRNIELIGACAAEQLPVLFHLDNDRNTDAPGLPGLAKLLEAVPDATLIGHGPGWWASISRAVNQADLGGYPIGPVAPGGALDRLLEGHPRLFADLSAGSGHNAIRRDLEFGRAFLQRHADQILFGTDYLAEDQVVEQFDLLESLDLPAAVLEKIYFGNAARLIE